MTWDVPDLLASLKNNESWSIEDKGQTILIKNSDSVEAYLAISGEQILVEIILFSSADVLNHAELNKYILKSHQLFPLSTIGINTIAEEDYYVAFGSLSTQSKIESVLIEVETLFNNVEAFLELYQPFLQQGES